MIPLAARRIALAALVGALALQGSPVGAQGSDPTRATLERDQQSAEFALRLRQSQQAAELERLRPGDLQLRQEMDALHLQQRQRIETLGDAQRLELQVRPPRAGVTPAPLYDRERGMALDQADRELADQVRRAERAKAEADPPRWGPTLGP